MSFEFEHCYFDNFNLKVTTDSINPKLIVIGNNRLLLKLNNRLAEFRLKIIVIGNSRPLKWLGYYLESQLKFFTFHPFNWGQFLKEILQI